MPYDPTRLVAAIIALVLVCAALAAALTVVEAIRRRLRRDATVPTSSNTPPSSPARNEPWTIDVAQMNLPAGPKRDCRACGATDPQAVRFCPACDAHVERNGKREWVKIVGFHLHSTCKTCGYATLLRTAQETLDPIEVRFTDAEPAPKGSP